MLWLFFRRFAAVSISSAVKGSFILGGSTSSISSMFSLLNVFSKKLVMISSCSSLSLVKPPSRLQECFWFAFSAVFGRLGTFCWSHSCMFRFLQLGGGDFRPTFRNTCGNLCDAIKQVRKCPLFRSILSFYPLDMAFEVCPFFRIAIRCSG